MSTKADKAKDAPVEEKAPSLGDGNPQELGFQQVEGHGFTDDELAARTDAQEAEFAKANAVEREHQKAVDVAQRVLDELKEDAPLLMTGEAHTVQRLTGDPKAYADEQADKRRNAEHCNELGAGPGAVTDAGSASLSEASWRQGHGGSNSPTAAKTPVAEGTPASSLPEDAVAGEPAVDPESVAFQRRGGAVGMDTGVATSAPSGVAQAAEAPTETDKKKTEERTSEAVKSAPRAKAQTPTKDKT